jgi:hypothetical protein
LHVVFARLTEHLSVLDAVSYKQVKSIYEEQWHGSTIAYFNQESERSDRLYSNGMPMSSKEKLISFDPVFGHNLTVMRFKTMFDNVNPTEATRTWANFKARMAIQAPKITRGEGIRRSDVYPQAKAAAATPLLRGMTSSTKQWQPAASILQL